MFLPAQMRKCAKRKHVVGIQPQLARIAVPVMLAGARKGGTELLQQTSSTITGRELEFAMVYSLVALIHIYPRRVIPETSHPPSKIR
jgi:hypothetical protein